MSTASSVVLEKDSHGLEMAVMCHPSGAVATVYLLGGHLTSWCTADGRERLFLSRRSCFAAGQPIRGGVPVIFPQFGDGPLPKHGLARTRIWELRRQGVQPDDAVWAVFGCASTAVAAPAAWPHAFDLELAVHLDAAGIRLGLRVTNTGVAPLPFQVALHTYFAVDDIAATRVVGLDGCEYLDSLRGRVRETETRPEIPFDRETDRIYLQTPDELRILGAAGGEAVRIRTQHLPDAVVWNPWIDKARAMEDFGDDEYRNMVCVETGAVVPGRILAPGEEWAGLTTYTAGAAV